MVNFIGEYTAKADDKGRLVFPSAFKAVMPADGDMRFVLKKDIFEDCLEMYTYEEWEKQSAEVRSHLNFLIRDHAAFWREYMRDRAIVEPDGKLGRISIPRKLLEAIGVQKEGFRWQRLQNRNLGQGEIRGFQTFRKRLHSAGRETLPLDSTFT